MGPKTSDCREVEASKGKANSSESRGKEETDRGSGEAGAGVGVLRAGQTLRAEGLGAHWLSGGGPQP